MAGGDGTQIGARLFERNASLDAPNRAQVMGAARHQDPWALRQSGPRDRRRPACDTMPASRRRPCRLRHSFDCAVDGADLPAKILPPESVAEHGDVIAARLILAVEERAATEAAARPACQKNWPAFPLTCARWGSPAALTL